MKKQITVQCQNCGTEFAVVAPPAVYYKEPGYQCPTCHFYQVIQHSPEVLNIHSQDELEDQLSTFIEQARMNGWKGEDIVSALRRELEFAAELAHPGRRLYVQLIDLGAQDSEPRAQFTPDQREILQSRSVGQ